MNYPFKRYRGPGFDDWSNIIIYRTGPKIQRRWCGKHIINPLLLQNISTLIQPSPPMPKWLPWVVCVTLTFAIKICKAIVNQVSVSRSAVTWWIWGLKCGWKCAVCEGEATVCPWLCQAAPDTHTHTHTHSYGLYLLWCEALKPLKLCGGSETMLNLKCDELWPLWLTMDAVQNNLNNRLYSHWRRIKGLQSELCIWSFTNTDMYIVHKYLFIYDFNVYVFL